MWRMEIGDKEVHTINFLLGIQMLAHECEHKYEWIKIKTNKK